MKKCMGVFGWLFGHNYIVIYETDKEYYSASEKVQILKQDWWNNPLGSLAGRENENYVNPVTQPKRVTQIFKGHLCKRCGHFTENNPVIL